jgi:BioD-like phosphotransacetylase family protein
LFVISGSDDSIVDDITFLQKYVDLRDVNFGGVVINKVHDLEDFNNTYLGSITEMGINVLGIIPYQKELTYFSVDYLSHYLFAKVIAGEGGLNNVVKNIFVGAMSADAALRKPLFQKEKKLIITGGDRSDMILAALESDTTCIMLTNNILPPSNIISKASDQNVPLLLVSSDTYQVAKQIDRLEPLLTKDNSENIGLVRELIKKYVNIAEIKGRQHRSA